MNEDTIRTRALNYTRTNWKMVIAYVLAAASTLVNVSIAVGRKQSDAATLTFTVGSLVTEVHELNDKVSTLSTDQAGMKSTLDSVHEDVGDFKRWKDKVTGVADTFVVPKASHRARK